MATAASGQTAASNRVIGVVTAMDVTAKQLTVKTDAGADVSVTFQDQTALLRIAPGEKDLKNATKIAVGDLAVGDRVLALGSSTDPKALSAQRIIVMSKTDIAKKHEADREEWLKRGVSGVVTAVNPAANEITVSTRSAQGVRPVVIAAKPEVQVRRYSPDSVRYSDAKPSTLAEVKVGDQVRALGDRTEDGNRLTAEQVVAGSFRNVAGTVQAIDPAAGEIKIRDLQSQKVMTVKVGPDASLRRMPPMMAAFLGRSGAPGAGGPGGGPVGGPMGGPNPGTPNSGRRPGGQPGPPPVSADAPARRGEMGAYVGPDGGGAGRPPMGGAPGGGPGGRGPGGGMGSGGGMGPGGMGGGMRGSGDLQQMLERMPTFPLAELKQGDAVIVASTSGSDPLRLNAVTLVAGVEPLFQQGSGQSMQQVLGGNWTLDMGSIAQ